MPASPVVRLRVCARCRAVRYCSRECQLGHWREHKSECVPVAQQQQQEDEAAST